MRVLVVHHGALPSPERPTSGGARRAAAHVDALRGAGHDVHTLGRSQDTPGGFRSPGDLRRLAAAIAPDWILCVSPEEAPALAGIAPLMVDLYAPRLLEGAWEGLQREEAARALAAVEAADEVLFSNPRQRWLWTGILGVSGWDLTTSPGLVVPLACLPAPAHAPLARPTFVVGGQPWPWQDARPCLEESVRVLDGRADIVSVGLPEVAGVRALTTLSLDAWLTLLSTATAALDRYTPNLERTFAQSFRQMDYLSAGLPLISDADTPLADELRATGSGWVDEPLAVALEAALATPRRSTLAERYAPARTEAPVLAWKPAPRERRWSLVKAGAALGRAEARSAADRARRDAAEAEAARLRDESSSLHAQLRALTASIEALSAATADISAFRREAVQVLGTRLSGKEAEGEHLRRELEIARADLQKKDAELLAAHAERDRVGRALSFLRGKG